MGTRNTKAPLPDAPVVSGAVTQPQVVVDESALRAWRTLNIEEKVTRAPVKRDVGNRPSSEPQLSEWIRNERVADMEHREELGEYRQLMSKRRN